MFLAREAEQGGQKSEYGRKTEAKRIPRKKTESILKIFNHPRKSDGWEDSSRSIQIVVLPGHQYNCFWNLFVFRGCGVNSIINNFTLWTRVLGDSWWGRILRFTSHHSFQLILFGKIAGTGFSFKTFVRLLMPKTAKNWLRNLLVVSSLLVEKPFLQNSARGLKPSSPVWERYNGLGMDRPVIWDCKTLQSFSTSASRLLVLRTRARAKELNHNITLIVMLCTLSVAIAERQGLPLSDDWLMS